MLQFPTEGIMGAQKSQNFNFVPKFFNMEDFQHQFLYFWNKIVWYFSDKQKLEVHAITTVTAIEIFSRSYSNDRTIEMVVARRLSVCL